MILTQASGKEFQANKLFTNDKFSIGFRSGLFAVPMTSYRGGKIYELDFNSCIRKSRVRSLLLLARSQVVTKMKRQEKEVVVSLTQTVSIHLMRS
jgi:hypothetical protein